MIHLPDGSSLSFKNSFKHYTLEFIILILPLHKKGTHVFQISVFNEGVTSKGFAATHVLSQNLGGINKEIIKLNSVLDEKTMN